MLVPLYEALDAKLQEAGMAQVAEIERRCLPTVAWLSGVGVGFDADALVGRLAADAAVKAEDWPATWTKRLQPAPASSARPGHSSGILPSK